MLFHIYRVSYGKEDTPSEEREYRVREFEQAYGRSPVGSTKEIADFIRDRLGVHDFSLEVYDPISNPDKNEHLEFHDERGPRGSL